MFFSFPEDARWNHVQAKNGEQEGRGHGRLVQSRSQHKGAHGDPPDYPELVDASAE